MKMICVFSVSLAMAVQGGAEPWTLLHPAEEFDAKKTVVWSPLFQATWDAMNAELGGKPEKIDPPNGLMARLDDFNWETEKVMPDGGWKVWGGKATESFVKKANQEAMAMTGEKKEPFRLEGASPAAVACFGLLNREVEFIKQFHEAKKRPLEFKSSGGKANVRFFGTKGELSSYYHGVVRILGHSGDWHALEVSCKAKDDRVVLYLPPEPQNFDAACGILRKLRNEPNATNKLDPSLNAGDDVRIPYVSLDTTADFTGRLGGGRYHGIAGDPWMISRAEQITKFELHEKGARVRVQTGIEAMPFGVIPPPPKPRHFIYDRPFYVFLWRNGADWPYFGVWVGDDSALRKF